MLPLSRDSAKTAPTARSPESRLEVLDLAETSISDKTLEELKKLPRLRQLFVGGTQVNAAAVSRVRQDRPDCQITWYEPGPEVERFQNIAP